MSSPGYLAAAIFVAAYVLIASDRFDKTKIALAGGALMIILGVVDQHTAFHGTHEVEGIDWNTIFLLMGMMIIVNITRRTGLFEWVAIKTAKIGRGRPIPILIGMMISTAFLSALLDNVTTVLLMVPTVIVIYEAMELDPVPFIIFVIMSSNIGGSLTLVGHPPNIMIASTTGFEFMDFIRINGPFVLTVFGLLLGFIWLWMRRRMTISEELRLRIMSFDETRTISDHRLLWRCLGVMALVFLGVAEERAPEIESYCPYSHKCSDKLVAARTVSPCLPPLKNKRMRIGPPQRGPPLKIKKAPLCVSARET